MAKEYIKIELTEDDIKKMVAAVAELELQNFKLRTNEQ